MIRRWMGLKSKIFLILIVALVTGLSSCRTARDMSATRLKPISADKLLDNAQKKAFDYEDLSIRRINVQFSNDDNRTSFRANLKASRDEKILASVSKLNIPVARVLLTSDDVTFVNYIDKNYFLGDYSYLSNMLNFDINFNVVQAVLSNPVKTYLSDKAIEGRGYETTVEEGKYVLQPGRRNGRFGSGPGIFQGRNNKNSVSSEIGDLEIKKLMFNPQSYVLEKMVLGDASDERRLEVDFSEFEKVDDYDYPGSIDIKMYSGDELTELNIKLRGFSTEKVENAELRVPDSYKRIHTR